MIIACPNCDTCFRIPDGVLGEKGRFLRCSHCNHEWLVEKQDAGLYNDYANLPVDSSAQGEAQENTGSSGNNNFPTAPSIKATNNSALKAVREKETPFYQTQFVRIVLPLAAIASVLAFLCLLLSYYQAQIIESIPQARKLYTKLGMAVADPLRLETSKQLSHKVPAGIRLLAEPAYGSQVLRAYGTEDRSVLDIHEDLSTGVTTQLAAEVGLCKKSIAGKPAMNSGSITDNTSRWRGWHW